MKVLIYGGDGWIGQMFYQQWLKLYPEDEVFISSIRVVPENSVQLHLEISQVDRIVCCLGRTSGIIDGVFINNIDFCEFNLHRNISDNYTAPVLLAKICELNEKHLLYIGTGCIFSWDTNADTNTKITEEDFPNFFGSAYSIVKGQTDSLMKEFKNVCNCRIRMPIVNYSHDRNFISKIVKYKNILSMNNSMTYLPEFIPIMINLSRSAQVGTWNCTNPGFINHKQILESFSHKIDPNHNCNFVKSEFELNLKSRRSNNILETKKLENWCLIRGLKLSSISNAIEDCFNNWKD